MDGSEAIQIDDGQALDIDNTAAEDTPRDFEAEARAHGWTPKEEFRGDAARWVDAETFVKRADEVMPFLQKQNKALKREIDDLKRTIKRSSEFFGKAEERAYQRAMADLEKRHDAAVETGDLRESRAVLAEMKDLTANAPGKIEADGAADSPDPAAKLAAWVEDNDWYVKDNAKRAYADIQAQAMGPATAYDGGPDAWLEELAKRVERKFATPRNNPANPGGNRQGAKGGKSYADLPPEARAICDKWVKQGVIKDRETYVKNYQW